MVLFLRGILPHKSYDVAAAQLVLSKLPAPADVELRSPFAGIQNQQHYGAVGVLKRHIFQTAWSKGV